MRFGSLDTLCTQLLSTHLCQDTGHGKHGPAAVHAL
jgi:hypothetical protein